MYVCSRERFEALPPPIRTAREVPHTYWKVIDVTGCDIGSVSEIGPGRFIAKLYGGVPVGEFATKNEAVRAVETEAAKPPF